MMETKYFGQIFGRLMVVGVERGMGKYKCVCVCGGYTITSITNLQRGATKSCGCLRTEAHTARGINHLGRPLAGQVFGRLTAIEDTGERKNGQSIWRCACACGGEARVRRDLLIRGSYKSCGCLRIPKKTLPALLKATTISASGLDIRIACDDHDTKDRILASLIGARS